MRRALKKFRMFPVILGALFAFNLYAFVSPTATTAMAEEAEPWDKCYEATDDLPAGCYGCYHMCFGCKSC